MELPRCLPSPGQLQAGQAQRVALVDLPAVHLVEANNPGHALLASTRCVSDRGSEEHVRRCAPDTRCFGIDHLGDGGIGLRGEHPFEAFEPPRKGQGQVWRIVDRLYNLPDTKHGTDVGQAVRFLQGRLRRMAIVFLLSDFILDEETRQLTDMPELKALARKHDVVPIVFEDDLETSLPSGQGLVRFRAAEGAGEILMRLSPGHRARFAALVERRKVALRDLFFSLGMEGLFLPVAEPYMDPLMKLFERRKKG